MARTNGFVETSVRDLVNTVFKHKGKILVVALLVFAGVTLYTYAVQEMYRSEAKVFIKIGRESLAIDPTVDGPMLPMLANRDNEVKSEVALLANRWLMEQVVQEIGPDYFLLLPDELPAEGATQRLRVFRSAARSVKAVVDNILYAADLKTPLDDEQKAVESGMENLTVEVERSSSIINVAFEAPGAVLARNILDRLLQRYLDRHIEVYSSQASPEFFEGQAAQLLAALTDAEKELETFRNNNGIVSLQAQRDALMERIVSLDGQAADVASQAEGARARLAVLEEALRKQPATLISSNIVRNVNPVVDNLRQVLVTLQQDEVEMASRYPENHRPLVELRDKIRVTRETIDQQEKTRNETTTAINSVHQDLTIAVAEERSQLDAKLAAHGVLVKELEKARAGIEALAGRESELNRLERHLAVAEEEYKNYRDNVKRSRISAALDSDKVSNVSIVQPATLPAEPARPNKPLNIGLGLLMGIFAGLCVAFLIEYLDDTLSTKEAAERRLGVPVVAVFSEEEFKGCI